MVFNNVAELFDSIEQTRARIYESVHGLSPQQSRFRPADDQWSVADIAEHLSMSESRLMKLVKSLVEQGAATLDAGGTIAPISIEYLVPQVSGKAQAPSFLQPGGNASLEESIERLRQTRGGLLALRSDLESKDFTTVIYKHESFGDFNPYQLLAFIGIHEQRHLKQIAALIASESFPAPQAANA